MKRISKNIKKDECMIFVDVDFGQGPIGIWKTVFRGTKEQGNKLFPYVSDIINAKNKKEAKEKNVFIRRYINVVVNNENIKYLYEKYTYAMGDNKELWKVSIIDSDDFEYRIYLKCSEKQIEEHVIKFLDCEN